MESGLTAPQLKELERLGPAVVKLKLQVSPGSGAGAIVTGFSSGLMTRSEVEDWLATKEHESDKRQDATLRWAKIAGWAGIVAVIVGIAAIVDSWF